MRGLPTALASMLCTLGLAASALGQYPPQSPYQGQPAYSGQTATPPVRLHFESSIPGVGLHLRTGSATAMVYGMPTPITAEAYQIVCVSPCDANLPAGTYYLGLSSEGGAAIGVDQPITVSDGVRLFGEYTSNRGVRIAGWVTMIVGALAALALVAVPLTSDDVGDTNFTPAYVGLGVLAATQIAGQIMIRIRDGADIVQTR